MNEIGGKESEGKGRTKRTDKKDGTADRKGFSLLARITSLVSTLAETSLQLGNHSLTPFILFTTFIHTHYVR